MTSSHKQWGTDDTPGIGAMFRDAWERSRGSISLMLVGVCVTVFLTVTLFELLGVVDRRQSVWFLGLSYPGVVERHWLHQFLTAPLMHGGIAHLLFNMLSLWMLGPSVEEKLGRTRYIVFSILCAAVSMGGFLLFDRGAGHVVLGYSGVIFGILAAQAVYFPNAVIAIYAFFPLKMKYAVLLMAAVELYLTLAPTEGGSIAHAAHVFGAAAALVYLWAIRPRSGVTEPPERPVVVRRVKAARAKNRVQIPREL